MSCAGCDDCPFDSGATGRGVAQQIHVTVAPPSIGRFKKDCDTIGVKPLIITNIFRSGQTKTEFITSSICLGGDAATQAEMKRIVEQLQSRRFRVIRQKIECSPTHNSIPTRTNHNRLYDGQYFESHLVVLTDSEDQSKNLSTVAKREGLFLSRNEEKWRSGDRKTIATLRSHSARTLNGFQDRVDDSFRHMRGCGLNVERSIVEFTRYDSNVSHDAAWMS